MQSNTDRNRLFEIQMMGTEQVDNRGVINQIIAKKKDLNEKLAKEYWKYDM